MKLQSSLFVRGLALLVFLLPSSAFAQFLTFYIDDAGNHLKTNQCFELMMIGNSQILLLFRDGLEHPKPGFSCNEEETWDKTAYTVKLVDADSPPLEPNIKVFAPKNNGNHAKIGGKKHPFRLYVLLDSDGNIADKVWITMPDESDHPSAHVENEGEHGGGAHGLR